MEGRKKKGGIALKQGMSFSVPYEATITIHVQTNENDFQTKWTVGGMKQTFFTFSSCMKYRGRKHCYTMSNFDFEILGCPCSWDPLNKKK